MRRGAHSPLQRSGARLEHTLMKTGQYSEQSENTHLESGTKNQVSPTVLHLAVDDRPEDE